MRVDTKNRSAVATVASLFALGVLGTCMSFVMLRLDVGAASNPPYGTDLPFKVRAISVACDSCGPSQPSPTPTHPPIATAVPTPSPTEAATGLSVRKGSWYTSSTGTIHVVGEVANNLSQPAEFVKVTARFYSSSGTLLATDFSFSDISILGPGTDSPFEVLLLSPPAGIASVEALVTDYKSPPYSGSQPIVGLAATVTNTYTSSIGTLHIVGTVTNSSGRTYRYVQPIFALYDSSGTVIRVDFTFTEPDTLRPGQTATFEGLIFGPISYSTIRIWVDAFE